MVLFNCLGKQQYKKQYKIFNEYIDSCLEYCCYLGSRHYALKYFVYLLFCHMAVLAIHQNPSNNVEPSSNIRQQWATSVPCLNRLRWAIWLVHNNPPSEMIHQKNSPMIMILPNVNFECSCSGVLNSQFIVAKNSILNDRVLSAAALSLCSSSSFSSSGRWSISTGCVAHCSERKCERVALIL